MSNPKEPWKDSDELMVVGELQLSQYCHPIRDDCGIVAITFEREEARRIVACVNACAGISTENLEDNVPVKELARRYNEAIRQRDELLAALEEATDVVIGHYGTGGRLAKKCLAALGSAKGGAV